MAHQAAALIDGFLGRFPRGRDRSARALPLWSKHRPGYATLLAFHGFGLEEAGDYARAEDISRAAAELEPLSFWPHHTVSHVMEMMGRPEDGLGWMAAREALWSSPGHMNQVHIWWHRALFHLELGQYDAALALYDGPMRATQRPVSLSLTNATALLWRLDTIGVEIGERWHEQADLWEGHADGKCLVFADIHAAMAELRSGRERRVERRLAAMRETAAGGLEAAGLYCTVGIPVVEGLTAFHRGAYAEAVDRCGRSASICGRSAAATRNATSSTGPWPRRGSAPANATLPSRSPTNGSRPARAASPTAAFCARPRPSRPDRAGRRAVTVTVYKFVSRASGRSRALD